MARRNPSERQVNVPTEAPPADASASNLSASNDQTLAPPDDLSNPPGQAAANTAFEDAGTIAEVNDLDDDLVDVEDVSTPEMTLADSAEAPRPSSSIPQPFFPSSVVRPSGPPGTAMPGLVHPPITPSNRAPIAPPAPKPPPVSADSSQTQPLDESDPPSMEASVDATLAQPMDSSGGASSVSGSTVEIPHGHASIGLDRTAADQPTNLIDNEATGHPVGADTGANLLHETLAAPEPGMQSQAQIRTTALPNDNTGGNQSGQHQTTTSPVGRSQSGSQTTSNPTAGGKSQVGTQAWAQAAPQPVTSTRQASKGRFPAIPGYEILSILGKGGMGVVYKARDVRLDRMVALKMILSNQAGREALARFQIEAKAVALLHHPNIVQVFESGETAGKPFVALEFLDGGTLQDKLKAEPQKPKDAAKMLETLARAMHYAHERGIVHRDLKPANVLLDSHGSPKITDFGLAKRLEQEDQGQTGAESILGTPTYMAPEQASGRTRDVGPGADIYALGAVLYDFLTGKPPLRGATIHETLNLVINNDPVPPRQLQPSVPLDLQTICLKCLMKEPAKRYATAEALADDLRRFLDGHPIAARPTSFIERQIKWARRKPAEALLALVSVAAVIAVIVGLVFIANQARKQGILEAEKARDAEARQKEAEEEQRKLAISEANAVDQKNEADKQRDEADKQRDEAQNQKKLVIEQNERANGNLADAQKILQKLTTVAQRSLRDKPGLDSVRRQILEDALVFSQSLLNRQNDDPASRLQAARANRLVGDIYEALGEPTKAEGAYRSTVGRYLVLAGPTSGDAQTRAELAVTYQSLWIVQERLEQRAEAARNLLHSREILGILVKEVPAEPLYQLLLARTYNDEGIQLLTATPSDLEGADAAFHQALTLITNLPAGELEKPSYILEVAQVEKNVAAVYLQRGQFDESARLSHAALDKLGRLVHEHAEVTAYSKEYGQVSANLAVLLITQANQLSAEDKQREAEKKLAEAEAICDTVVTRFQELTRKFGDIADNRHLLALSLASRADVIARRGQPERARKDITDARDILQRLLDDLPDQTAYAVDLAKILNQQGMILLRTNRSDEAVAAWDKALALCQPLAKDPKRTEAARQRDIALFRLLNWFDQRSRVLVKREAFAEAAVSLARLVELHEKVIAYGAFDADGGVNPLAVAALGTPAALPGVHQEFERANLASTRLALAELLLAQRDHAAVLALVAELAKAPAGWSKSADAALVAARVLNLIRDDSRLTDSERRRRTEMARAQVIALLRRAEQQHSTVTPGFLDNPAFASLAEDAEFKDLRNSLEQHRAGQPR